MRRKEEASKVKQTIRQSNTAHPRQSLLQGKNELPRVGLKPTTLYTLDRVLYQYVYIHIHYIQYEQSPAIQPDKNNVLQHSDMNYKYMYKNMYM